jgi:hypothetical protein
LLVGPVDGVPEPELDDFFVTPLLVVEDTKPVVIGVFIDAEYGA